jgi:hypothetical protein
MQESHAERLQRPRLIRRRGHEASTGGKVQTGYRAAKSMPHFARNARLFGAHKEFHPHECQESRFCPVVLSPCPLAG